MLKKILCADALWTKWFIIIRVITGVMIARYGLEVFNQTKMDGNVAWLKDLHFPALVFMAYLGKGAELVGGLFLIVGLLTRFAAAVPVVDMLVIIFIMGGGHIFGDEQLPFLLMTFFLVFFIQGGGEWSLDRLLFSKRTSVNAQ